MAFAVTHDFSPNTVISSTQVNTNFGDVETAINAITNYISAGSITNAMLAQITTASKVSGAALTGLANIPSGAGSIPIANLGIQASQAVGTSSPNTASTDYTDLGEMSITLTTGANPVFISFSGVFSNNTLGFSVWIVIDIDGVEYAERYFNQDVANNAKTLATSILQTMTAGSHTFKIRWKVGGGTGTAQSRRAMQVIEL